jgi:hypothetical protein
MGRKSLEDAAQEKLDGTRLGREPGDAGDVEMSGFWTEEKVTIQVNRGLETTGGVESHWYAGGPLMSGVSVHSESLHNVGVGGEPDGPEGNWLERLLGHLPKHGGGI